jgi:hypothetical protein
MISLKFRSSLAIAIICFILGICAAILLSGSCNGDKVSPNLVQPELLKQKADSITLTYNAVIMELENRNAGLQKELTGIKAQLNAVKPKAKTRATTIKKMIEPKGFPTRDLLKKVESSGMSTDSSLSPCDSLVKEVTGYLEYTELKDSLNESRAVLQDSIIAGKDSIITVKSLQYEGLLNVFNQSVEQQEILLAENKTLQKEIKRQKRKGKLLAIGTAILSAIATNYLLNH